MTNTTGPRAKRTQVLSAEEFDMMLAKAKDTKPQYYSLRDRFVLCVFRLTGKRVSEVARLKQKDLIIQGDNLSITFTVSKKRRTETLLLRREKQISLTNPYTQPILEYKTWMEKNAAPLEPLLPQTCYSVFSDTLTLGRKPLSTRQILRVVQKYNPSAWCHLFRETVGADIVRADGSIMAVWKVKKRLDLERTETAWRYMDRYGLDVIDREA